MSSTAGAFRYLIGHSLRNRAQVLLRRVRAPRYALALLTAGAYYYFVFHSGSQRGPVPPGMAVNGAGIYEALLAASIAWMWVFGVAEPALAFTSAEVQLLFPAPVTRRALIHYKLAQTQVAILLNVAIWLLLLSRNSPVSPLLKAAALWVLFTTLYLHRVGASFVRVSAAQRGLKGIRKNAFPLAVATAAILAVGWTVVRALPSLNAALTDGTITTALAGLRQARAIRFVLWPLHAVVSPVFARSTDEWRTLIGWALLLLAVNYAWVMRTGVAFEEAAMQRSERIAAQRAAMRNRGGARVRSGRAWLLLPPSASPVSAIMWKNATALQRLVPLGRVLAVSVAIAIVIVAWLPSAGTAWSADIGWQMLRTVALILAGVFVMLGPVYVRTDLQQDMLVLPLLRAYPLTGATIVAGEIASTVAILTVFQAVLLTIGFPLLAELAGGALSVPIAIAGLFAVPAITALRVAVANGWAILLPGWIHLGPGRAAGIEALGQNVVSILGSFIAHMLLLIIPAAFSLPVIWVGAVWLDAWAMVPAAIVGAVVAAAELWLLVRWLGGVLSRTDPSDVEAAMAS